VLNDPTALQLIREFNSEAESEILRGISDDR
jgi:hypothetical protein